MSKVSLADIMGSPKVQSKLKKLIDGNREVLYLMKRLSWREDRGRKDDFEDRYLC